MRSGQQWSKFVGLVLVLSLMVGCAESKKPGSGSGTTGGTTGAAVTKEGAIADLPGCEGAVVPSLETIEKGEYTPLSRPLFVYVNKKALKKPEVAGYVKVMLGKAQDYVEKAGFIKLKESLLKEQQAKLDAEIADVKFPEKLTAGSVSANGSSTVFPFSVVAAELFEKANENVRVTVGKKGTGGGFEKFCTGETDISNASRPIKQNEIDKCAANNVEYLELTVCIDGLTVCVNPKNDWCSCLTVEQLKSLWEPTSTIKKWNQLNPAWPDADIELFGADTDSGTFDYFTEVIVGKSKSSRSDYTASSEDNTLVKGIEGNKHALGYFGYSYYDKNRKKLKAVGIIPAAKSEKK
ncbi:MAG: phosphate binding protein [Planctomycetaceae bacterium]|nr:phosphate binding protein [Planctomycetaceae bacterium]